MSNVAIVLGFPASGKTTTTQMLVDKKYFRLNRDVEGGSVIGLLPVLEEQLKAGKNVVLDNLFATEASRQPFIAAAKKHGATIDCHWMQTSIEDAQLNYCLRSMRKYNKVLESYKGDPNIFPPAVIFKYRKEFQKPTTKEGFDSVVKIPFIRVWDDTYCNKALILDYDGTLRECVGGNGKYPVEQSQVKLLPNRTKKIDEFKNNGFVICGASNQSGVAKKHLSSETAVELFQYTNKLLEHDIDFKFDPSGVPPIRSWSRKPVTGMGAHFIEKYKLNPSKCIMVGDLKEDETFASRCGFQFIHANQFFGD